MVWWLAMIIGLVIGLLGGFLLGVWYFRRAMSNMEWDDRDLMQMAKRMGTNLNPRQLQLVKQQMKKAGSNPPPLFGRKKSSKVDRAPKKR